MKTSYTKILAILFFLILNLNVFSQIKNLPYSENFSSGIPDNWTQNSPGGVTWASVEGKAVADMGETSGGAATAWLQGPALNLTSVSNPVLRFKVRLYRKQFIAPSVSLWYSIAGSQWSFVDSWGKSGTPNSTAAMNEEVLLSASLSRFSGQTNIRFSFGADFTNGGEVTIDEVSFTSGATYIIDGKIENTISISPNPGDGLFNVKVREGAKNIKIDIIDLTGKSIYSANYANASEFNINLTDQVQGIYFLKMVVDDEIINKKIVSN